MSIKVYEERIDIVKGLAIILVVIGHTIQFCDLNGGVLNPVYQWIYSFHMGLFFFCSGYLFTWIDFRNGAWPIIYQIGKKFRRILIPFLVWGCIYFTFCSIQFDVNHLIDKIIIHPIFGLWFLEHLFVFNILFMLLTGLFNLIDRSKFRNADVYLILVGILLLLVSRNFAMFFIGSLVGKSDRIKVLFSNHKIASFAFFTLILSILIPDLLDRRIVCISAVIVFFNIGGIQDLKQPLKKELSLFGKNSMQIFILHPLLLYGMGGVIHVYGIDHILLFVECLILAVPICYLCILSAKLCNIGYVTAVLFGDKIKKA